MSCLPSPQLAKPRSVVGWRFARFGRRPGFTLVEILVPERPGRYQEKHQADKHWVLRLEFKRFVNAFVRLPCQIVRTGRKLVYRLLAWNPYQPIFFRLVDVLRC